MKKIFSLAFIFSLLVVPHFVQAGFLDGLACVDGKANCSLDDVKTGFITLTKLLIGSVGALALLYFIWGGIQWMTSYGNQQKIQHGRDIMLQTVVALVVAFTSFLLVEFFVNDFLKAESPITSECANQKEGKLCGQNYVCSGTDFKDDQAVYNEICMSKCQLKSIKDDSTNWTCLSPAIAEMSGVISEKGLCPGKDICVDVNSIALDTSSAPTNEFAGKSCCVNYTVGRPSCSEISYLDECLAGQTKFGTNCSEVDMCDQNWVQADIGCCVSNAGESICRVPSEGIICDNLSAQDCENIVSCGCTSGCLE